MNRVLRLLPLLLLVLLAVAVWASGAPRYLHMETLREHAVTLRGLVRQHPVLAFAAYVGVVAITTASSVPGGIPILMLAAGCLFGTWVGGVAAAAGVTLGAALVYGAVRSSLGAMLRERADRSGGRLKALLDGVRGGAFGWFGYIVTLRLIPFAPFELVSIAVALAGAPFRAYLLGTLLGVMPATFLYSGVGAEIGRLIGRGETPHLHTLLTPRLVIPLLALGLLSLAATIVVHRRARTKAAGPPG